MCKSSKTIIKDVPILPYIHSNRRPTVHNFFPIRRCHLLQLYLLLKREVLYIFLGYTDHVFSAVFYNTTPEVPHLQMIFTSI